MFLRSLTLKGFKSFADKTTLEFAPGISVIVGPNGSGKSNIVDAISWVLGEQGARALRGAQMADVIFAGSPKRAALGMAEVHLVIDNEAGKIPVPMTELEISRAIFRSGDSEYKIGGEACRLLDIQELLSDSGIGRALHTVVSQGQLEEVLTSRPEERRQYIEEAAGIAKHRRRKDRAQRKLGSLEQDLLRLQDVLNELRRQLKPLRAQADVAQKHEKLTNEADTLAWRLAAARLGQLIEARESKRAGWEAGLAVREDGKKRLEELDAKIAQLTAAREQATADLTEAEATAATAHTAKAVAEVAFKEAAEHESQAQAKLASEAARTIRLSTLEDEIHRVGEQLRDGKAELVDREAELQQAEAAFREAEQQRREAEEERRRLGEEAAAHRAEMETIRRSLASYERERERLEKSLAAARERIVAAEAEGVQLHATVQRYDEDSTPLTKRRESLEAEKTKLTAKAAELDDLIRRHEARQELFLARSRDLEETPGSRFLVSHHGRSIGLLRELIRVEKGLARALVAALGPYADAVVYEDAGRAIADAEKGEGAILAVAIASDAPEPSLPGERSLMSAVKPDARVEGLVGSILKDVYLARDTGEAASKHDRHPQARFVTADGVMVGREIIQTAPEAGTRARSIGEELSNAEAGIAEARNLLGPVKERLEDIDSELQAVAADLGSADAGITSAAGRLTHLERDLASGRKEEEILTQRLAGMDEAAASWRDTLAAAESDPQRAELPPMPPFAEQPISARVAVETLRRDRTTFESRLESLRDELSALAAETPELIRATAEAAETARQAAEAQLQLAGESHEAALTARDAAAAAERAATGAENDANRAWREAAAQLDSLREEYEEDDRARGDLDRRIKDAELLLREGHGRDPDEALASLTADDTVPAIERKAELVQRRLQLLGRVNLLAGGEFEAIQERHDFLARELDDVKKARRDLFDVIRRVDEEVIQLFEAAYRDVASTFEVMFKDLFPGGEGRLVLTDPADLLNTGIEVEARPGRKRVKRLSLLSGGERALTALCFLFSIFKARPSPFYLLDEVEPALDDVNLHRFLGLIKQFAEHSQVIVVTHQKRTMEAADMMYGVSMSKESVTRVVSQRLEDMQPATPSPVADASEPPKTPPVEPIDEEMPQTEPVY